MFISNKMTCSSKKSLLKFLKFVSQEVLEYLWMFTEGNAGTNINAHPLNLVLDAFKDDEAMTHTTQKLHTFLEEVMKMHSSTLARGILPDDALPQKV